MEYSFNTAYIGLSREVIFSYVGLKMSTAWLAQDIVFIMRLARIFPGHLRYSDCKPNA